MKSIGKCVGPGTSRGSPAESLVVVVPWVRPQRRVKGGALVALWLALLLTVCLINPSSM